MSLAPPPKQSKRKKRRNKNGAVQPQIEQQSVEPFISINNVAQFTTNNNTGFIANDNPFRDPPANYSADQKVSDIFNQNMNQNILDEFFVTAFESNLATAIPKSENKTNSTIEDEDQNVDESGSDESAETDSTEEGDVNADKNEQLARKYVIKKLCDHSFSLEITHYIYINT